MRYEPGHSQDEIIEMCEEAGFPTDTSYISIIISRLEGKTMEPLIAEQNDWGTYAGTALTEQLDRRRELLLIPPRQRNERGMVLHVAEQICRRKSGVRIGVGASSRICMRYPEAFKNRCLLWRPALSPRVHDRNVRAELVRTTYRLGDVYLEFHHCLKHKPQELAKMDGIVLRPAHGRPIHA